MARKCGAKKVFGTFFSGYLRASRFSDQGKTFGK